MATFDKDCYDGGMFTAFERGVSPEVPLLVLGKADGCLEAFVVTCRPRCWGHVSSYLDLQS